MTPNNPENPPASEATLRDLFAAKAMAALIVANRFTVGTGEPSRQTQAANTAYSHADAMLAARQKGSQP